LLLLYSSPTHPTACAPGADDALGCGLLGESPWPADPRGHSGFRRRATCSRGACRRSCRRAGPVRLLPGASCQHCPLRRRLSRAPSAQERLSIVLARACSWSERGFVLWRRRLPAPAAELNCGRMCTSTPTRRLDRHRLPHRPSGSSGLLAPRWYSRSGAGARGLIKHSRRDSRKRVVANRHAGDVWFGVWRFDSAVVPVVAGGLAVCQWYWCPRRGHANCRQGRASRLSLESSFSRSSAGSGNWAGNRPCRALEDRHGLAQDDAVLRAVICAGLPHCFSPRLSTCPERRPWTGRFDDGPERSNANRTRPKTLHQ